MEKKINQNVHIHFYRFVVVHLKLHLPDCPFSRYVLQLFKCLHWLNRIRCYWCNSTLANFLRHKKFSFIESKAKTKTSREKHRRILDVLCLFFVVVVVYCVNVIVNKWQLFVTGNYNNANTMKCHMRITQSSFDVQFIVLLTCLCVYCSRHLVSFQQNDMRQCLAADAPHFFFHSHFGIDN